MVKEDVTFQILMSYLQLCKTNRNPAEIILIMRDGICNRRGLNKLDVCQVPTSLLITSFG